MEIDKALTILQKTHDGDDLTPEHLKLLELAVNGYLNETGLEEFEKLYQAVESGYQRPAYLGVEFMDRNQEGFVFFKGQRVEHYSSFWAYSLDARAALKRLQQQCLFLEANGLPVTHTLQCSWRMGGKYAEDFALLQKSRLDELVGERAILFSLVKTEDDSFLMAGHPSYDEVLESPRYQDICGFRNRSYPQFSVISYVYGPGRMWSHAARAELDCIDCCFDYLKDKTFLQEISNENHKMPPWEQTAVDHAERASLIFSAVRMSDERGNELNFYVGGSPDCYDELMGCSETVEALESAEMGDTVEVDVQTYLYGSGESEPADENDLRYAAAHFEELSNHLLIDHIGEHQFYISLEQELPQEPEDEEDDLEL